jgi:hypothetical protein
MDNDNIRLFPSDNVHYGKQITTKTRKTGIFSRFPGFFFGEIVR